MDSLINDWVGKSVRLTLRIGGVAGVLPVDGKLVKIAESGVLIELGQGPTFVPVTSILHISLSKV